MDLNALLGGLETKVADILSIVPTVEELNDPALDNIPGQGSEKWLKIPDVVAVVFDLKSSTQLGTGRHDTSTARIYKAAVESSVAVASEFDAQFIDIQGDGGFALFWGDLRYERALCAAVTIRTFSGELVEQFERKFPNGLPETGFKVGVASGRVLVKQLGTPRNVDEQEAVWAGRPVNYAAKAAQSADRHQVIVTGSVWDHFESNDYVVYSCGCKSGPTAGLWRDVTIDKVPDKEKSGRLLEAGWCENCGAGFCDAIRSGKSKRSDIPEAQRHSLTMTMMASAIAKKDRVDRAQARRLRALRH